MEFSKEEIDTMNFHKESQVVYKMGYPEDDGKIMRETMAKENELYLCILGQVMPLVNGNRRKWNSISMGDFCKIGGFESCWDMSVTIAHILESEWGYAKVIYGEEYEI